MKKISYKTILNYIWASLIIVTILITIFSSRKSISSLYDKQIEASNLSKECLNKISLYNENRGMELNEADTYNSYLLGTNKYNLITTTTGSVSSKRTSLNPNYAALFIKMFSEAGIKEGDEVAICISSSFPGLNISCLCACQVMNLKTCVMSSIGSSQLGANDPEFVFPEWVDYLYNLGLLNKRVDYVSYGGEYDTSEGFFDNSKRESEKEKPDSEAIIDIKNRLVISGHNFIEIEDFKENIETRMSLINNKLKNLKLFINIGGSVIGLGKDESSKYLYRGVIKPNYLKSSKTYNTEYSGLMERYLVKGVTAISMLNMKGICTDYNMVYDPVAIQDVTGKEDIYFDIKYNKVFPIITLSISAIILGYNIFIGIKKKKEENRVE